MPLATVQAETFANTGTITTGGSAAMGTITGTFHKRRYGVPTDGAGNRGWSAAVRDGVTFHVADVNSAPHSVNSASGALWLFQAWYYINQVSYDGTNKIALLNCNVSNGNQYIRLLLGGTASAPTLQYTSGIDGTWSGVDFTPSLPLSAILRRWTCFRLAVQKISAGPSYNVELMYRLAGASSWTTLRSLTGNVNGVQIQNVGGGGNRGGGSTSVIMRYGRPLYASMGAWSERYDAAPGESDPTWPDGTAAKRPVWFYDPVGGSDTNAGDASNAAFRTLPNLTTESSGAGLFFPAVEVVNADGTPSTAFTNGGVINIQNALADALPAVGNRIDADAALARFFRGDIRLNGDIVNVVANNGAAQRLAGSVTLTAPGVTLQTDSPLYNATFDALKVMTGWSKTAGRTWTYQTADIASAGGAYTAPYQARAPLTKINAANLTAAGPLVDATPGSHWSDGTTLYVRPLFDIDPTVAANANLFERVAVTPGGGPTGVIIAGANQCVRGLTVNYTLQWLPANSDTSGGYGMGSQSVLNSGLQVFQDCITTHNDKHASMFVGGPTFRRALYINCGASLASPTGGTGAVGDFGIYSSLNDGQGDDQLAALGLHNLGFGLASFNSPLGQQDYEGGNFFQAHGNGGNTSVIQKIFFDAIRSPHTKGMSLQLPGCLYRIRNSTLSACAGNPGNSAATGTQYEDCTFERAGSPGGTYTRCALLMRDQNPNNSLGAYRITGNAAFTDCLFDLSESAGASAFWFLWADGLTLTFTRCRIRLPSGLAFMDWSNRTVSGSPAVKFVACTFEAADGTGHALCRNVSSGGVSDRTLAQLQAIGVADAACKVVTTAPEGVGSVWPTSPASGGGSSRLSIGI